MQIALVKETIYAKTLNEIRHQLRTEQYEDEKMLNVISKEMTLDEWCEIWMNTCKKNLRRIAEALPRRPMQVITEGFKRNLVG